MTLQPILNSILQPTLKSILGDLIQRYFTTLASAASQYYQFATPIALAGDFEIDFDFCPVGTGAGERLLASFDTNNGFDLYYDAVAAVVKVKTGIAGAASYAVCPEVVVPYVFTHCKFSRAGNVYTVIVGAGAPHNFTKTGVVLDIYRIATSASVSSNFNGIIANLKVKDAGTLVVDMPLDENWSTSKIARNKAIPLGSELIANSGLSNPNISYWESPRANSVISSVNNNVVATAINTNVFGITQTVTGLIVGKSYILSGSGVVNTAAAKLRFRLGDRFALDTDFVVNYESNAPQSGGDFLITATATTMFVGFISTGHLPGSEITIDKPISLKEATNYANAINITSTDAELFTYNETYTGWSSNTELITQDVWENPFTVGNQWTFADNKWSMVGLGDANALQPIIASGQPLISLLTGIVNSISGTGTGVATQSSNTGINTLTSIGSYDFIIDKTLATAQQFKRYGGVMNVTLSKPSFKKFIPLGDA